MTLTVHSKAALALMFLVPLCLSLGAALFDRFGPSVVINDTLSEPRGVYRLVPRNETEYVRGMYVVFPVPAAARGLVYGRGWLRDGLPLLKEIAGLGGDEVCITASAMALNGALLGTVLNRDSQGLPLPQLRGCFVIPRGSFLAVSRHYEKSFDGRYFGALPLSSVRGEAVPVWTF